MMACPNLRKLDVSYNGIGDEGFQSILRGLARCPSLESLDASNNGLSDAACFAFASYLNGNYAQPLVKLRSKRGEQGYGEVIDDDQEALNVLRHRKSSVVSLVLSSNSITGEGLKSIANALKHCYEQLKAEALLIVRMEERREQKQYREAVLRGATIPSPSKQAVPDPVATLKKLDLSFNKLGDNAAETVAKLVESYPLEILKIRGADISYAGFAGIAAACREMRSMLELDILDYSNLENPFLANGKEQEMWAKASTFHKDITEAEARAARKEYDSLDEYWARRCGGYDLQVARLEAEQCEKMRVRQMHQYISESGEYDNSDLMKRMHKMLSNAEAYEKNPLESTKSELEHKDANEDKSWRPPQGGDLSFACYDGEILVHEDICTWSSLRVVQLLDTLIEPCIVDPSLHIRQEHDGKIIIFVDSTLAALEYFLECLYTGAHDPEAKLPNIEDKLSAIRLAEIFGLPAFSAIIAASAVEFIYGHGPYLRALTDACEEEALQATRESHRGKHQIAKEHLEAEIYRIKQEFRGSDTDVTRRVETVDKAQHLASSLLVEGIFQTSVGSALTKLCHYILAPSIKSLFIGSPEMLSPKSIRVPKPQKNSKAASALVHKRAQGDEENSPTKTKNGKLRRHDKKEIVCLESTFGKSLQTQKKTLYTWVDYESDGYCVDPKTGRPHMIDAPVRDIDLMMVLNCHTEMNAKLKSSDVRWTNMELDLELAQIDSRSAAKTLQKELSRAGVLMKQAWEHAPSGIETVDYDQNIFRAGRETNLLEQLSERLAFLFIGKIEPSKFRDLELLSSETFGNCDRTLSQHGALQDDSTGSVKLAHDGSMFVSRPKISMRRRQHVFVPPGDEELPAEKKISIYMYQAATITIEKCQQYTMTAMHLFKVAMKKALRMRDPAFGKDKIELNKQREIQKRIGRGDLAETFDLITPGHERVLQVGKTIGLSFNSTALLPGQVESFRYVPGSKTDSEIETEKQQEKANQAELEAMENSKLRERREIELEHLKTSPQKPKLQPSSMTSITPKKDAIQLHVSCAPHESHVSPDLSNTNRPGAARKTRFRGSCV